MSQQQTCSTISIPQGEACSSPSGVIVLPGDGFLLVKWVNSFAPSYTVSYADSVDNVWHTSQVINGGNQSIFTYTINGLTNGHKYSVKVCSKCLSSDKCTSVPNTYEPNGNPCLQCYDVENLSVIYDNTNPSNKFRAKLSWSPSLSTLLPVRYRVEYAESSNGNFITVSSSQSDSYNNSILITPPPSQRDYTFRVTTMCGTCHFSSDSFYDPPVSPNSPSNTSYLFSRDNNGLITLMFEKNSLIDATPIYNNIKNAILSDDYVITFYRKSGQSNIEVDKISKSTANAIFNDQSRTVTLSYPESLPRNGTGLSYNCDGDIVSEKIDLRVNDVIIAERLYVVEIKKRVDPSCKNSIDVVKKLCPDCSLGVLNTRDITYGLGTKPGSSNYYNNIYFTYTNQSVTPSVKFEYQTQIMDGDPTLVPVGFPSEWKPLYGPSDLNDLSNLYDVITEGTDINGNLITSATNIKVTHESITTYLKVKYRATTSCGTQCSTVKEYENVIINCRPSDSTIVLTGAVDQNNPVIRWKEPSGYTNAENWLLQIARDNGTYFNVPVTIIDDGTEQVGQSYTFQKWKIDFSSFYTANCNDYSNKSIPPTCFERNKEYHFCLYRVCKRNYLDSNGEVKEAITTSNHLDSCQYGGFIPNTPIVAVTQVSNNSVLVEWEEVSLMEYKYISIDGSAPTLITNSTIMNGIESLSLTNLSNGDHIILLYFSHSSTETGCSKATKEFTISPLSCAQPATITVIN